MSTKDYIQALQAKPQEQLNAEGMKLAIVVSEWNYNITGKLMEGAVETLLSQGVKQEDIQVYHVPGSFELTYASAKLAKSGQVDAIIALGSVVRGDTPHFDYVCQGTTQGIAQLNAEGRVPVIFGLLTTDNMQQAEDRAGGCLGNKGSECALTAIKMIQFGLEITK